MFLYCFDVFISKIIFFKKIILMYFQVKHILKVISTTISNMFLATTKIYLLFPFPF